MLQSKLAVLDYPADEVDFDSVEQVRELVLFLEDHHIRSLKIEDRMGLRSDDSNLWNNAYVKYLKKLNCPLSPETDSHKEIIDWLVTFAVHIIYSKNEAAGNLTAEKYAQLKAEKEAKRISDDPLSAFDLNNDEFKNGVESLRNTFGIATHPDHIVVLKAVCMFIIENLSDEAIERANNDDKTNKKAISLKQVETGMAPKRNASVEAAMRVLRLLHLKNLREVQTEINEVIVAVQKLTADPKTDKTLGKVGY